MVYMRAPPPVDINVAFALTAMNSPERMSSNSAPPTPAVFIFDQGDGPLLVEECKVGHKNVFFQTGHYLYAGEVAPVNGAVEALTGEGLLQDSALGVPVEKAA